MSVLLVRIIWFLRILNAKFKLKSIKVNKKYYNINSSKLVERKILYLNQSLNLGI